MGRRLGQHFLTDSGIAEAIVAAARIEPDDCVLEIGGGPGALTQHLLDSGARRVVVELDDALAANLARRWQGRIEVVNADVLTLRLAELGAGRRWVVLGNLPYYATSPILLWLAEQWRDVARAVVMIQKEVAQRVSAQPGGRDWGRLSVALALRAYAQSVLDVPPESFRPPPKVDSAVLRLTFRESPAVAVANEARFFDLVEFGFRHRRKTLGSALALGLAISRERVEELLAAAGVDSRRRAESLELADWAALCAAAESRL